MIRGEGFAEGREVAGEVSGEDFGGPGCDQGDRIGVLGGEMSRAIEKCESGEVAQGGGRFGGAEREIKGANARGWPKGWRQGEGNEGLVWL